MCVSKLPKATLTRILLGSGGYPLIHQFLLLSGGQDRPVSLDRNHVHLVWKVVILLQQV